MNRPTRSLKALRRLEMKNKQLSCDVVVAGAGISGVAAAISSGRAGSKTILFEENSSPGGVARDCLHRYICGLYPKNTGLAKEIICALQKLNPRQNKFSRLGKLTVFSFVPADLSIILQKLIRKEKNLQVFYNSQVSGVRKKGGKITSVQAHSLPLNLTITAGAFVDATGCGSLIRLSKANSQLAPLKSRQLAGFTFQIEGLKDKHGLLPIKVPYELTLAVNQKKLPYSFKFTKFSYGPEKNSGTIKLNLPPVKTQRQKNETKKYACLAISHLRKTLPEFKASRIKIISAGVHEREGLRLLGKHILTEKEVLGCRKSPNAVAKGYWPIEFWDQKRGPKIQYLKPGKFYEIPLNCLKSVKITNLFATGKCISASPKALASTRVMGTCIYLGEAAGKLAAKLNKQ